MNKIVKTGPWCKFYSKFVKESCWMTCLKECRYREYMSAVDTGSEIKPFLESVPNFYCTAEIVITDNWI